MRYLEAIEADDFPQLPGGIFNRSFVKAYARQVGYNEDEAIEAYNRTAREQGAPADEEMPTSYQPRVYTNGDSTRSPWVNLLFAAIIVGIISLGAYALQHWYRRTASETPAPVAAVVTNAPAPSVAAQTLQSVQVRAVGESVSLTVQADGAPLTVFTLSPADAAREYTPRNRLSFRYAREKADALEVTINGQRARVPSEGTTRTTEMVITPDNFQQLLQ